MVGRVVSLSPSPPLSRLHKQRLPQFETSGNDMTKESSVAAGSCSLMVNQNVKEQGTIGRRVEQTNPSNSSYNSTRDGDSSFVGGLCEYECRKRKEA